MGAIGGAQPGSKGTTPASFIGMQFCIESARSFMVAREKFLRPTPDMSWSTKIPCSTTAGSSKRFEVRNHICRTSDSGVMML